MSASPEMADKQLTDAVNLEVDIPEIRKEMSKDEMHAAFLKILDNFVILENMTNLKSLYQNGKALAACYHVFKDIHTKEISEWLLKSDFASYSTKALKRLNNLGVFKSDDIWFSSFYFYTINWNTTDINANYAKAVTVAGLPSLLRLNVTHKPYLENLSCKNVTYLIKASLSIINNLMKVPDNWHYFKDENDEGVKKSLLELLQKNENDVIRGLCAMILVRLVSEDEAFLLGEESGAVQFLNSCIDQALHKSSKRRGRGFIIAELVDALAALSVKDSIKKTFLDYGTICLLIEICEQDKDDREVLAASKIFWNLSFDEKLKERLITEHNITAMIEKLRGHRNEDIKFAAEGTMWMISSKDCDNKKEINTNTISKSSSKEKYVFACYCSNDKHAMLVIRDKLLLSGINVWVDFERTKHDVSAAAYLQTVIQGICDSSSVLMCVSDAFAKDEFCRMQVQTATKLNKILIPIQVHPKYKPEGYLRFISCSKYYQDCNVHDKLSFDQICDKVVEYFAEIFHTTEVKKIAPTTAGVQTIEKHLKHADSMPKAAKVVNNCVPSAANILPSTTKESPIQPMVIAGHKSVANWNTEDVKTWLENESLGYLTGNFKEIDGLMLIKMADMRHEAADFFYKSFSSSLNLSFVDILKFMTAFDHLKI